MDNATDPNKPTPVLACGGTDTPMHYLFEIQFITNQVVGAATAENRTDFALKVKTQHVRRYLVKYYKKHAVLPTGRHYLGMTRPYNLEVGMVDFGAIRQKIRADSETWNHRNVESPENLEDLPDYLMHSEIETGMRGQAAGRESNKVVLDLRQELIRRGKKG